MRPSIGELLLLTVAAIGAVASAATFQEDFTSDPAANGWALFGNSDLFRWNASQGALDVQWDSSQTNSYYHRPLRTVLTRQDDVELSFDLRLDELEVGVAEGKPFTFELAVGLMRWRDASSPGFVRGSARQSPNLVEFDYFADSGFGATVSPVIVSSNSLFTASFTFPLELTLEDTFHVQLRYTGATGALTTTMLRNGEPFGPVKPVQLGPEFTDFRVDTFAIASYSDTGSDGSLRARGTIDNVVITTPDPPRPTVHGAFLDGHWTAAFLSRSNWVYVLEWTEDWRTWHDASAARAGTGSELELRDAAAAPRERSFYRVRLDRP